MSMRMRTKQPCNNPYYIRKASGGYNGAVKGIPTIKGADVLCNCVGYANGRFAEIQDLGCIKYQLVCNAENFIERAKAYGLKISAVPVLGGIMVWQKGSTLSGNDGAGHVAVVERVINSSQIITSESGWDAWAFKIIARSNFNGRWGQNGAYTFRGCIVNPAIGAKGAEKIEKIAVDGEWGIMTTLFSQQILKTFQDGFVSGQRIDCMKYLPNAMSPSWEFVKNGEGSSLIKAIQKLVGASQDGIAGQNTVKAMQRFLKAQGKYKYSVDGIMGKNTVMAWQKWLNNPTYKEVKETLSDKILKACEVQAKWMKNYKYKWQSNPTVEKSKKYGTCVTYVACVLQRLGYLKAGECIWHTSKGRIYGTNDKMSVIYEGKSLKALKDKIKAGDIIVAGNPKVTGAGNSGSHIFIVTGKWSGNNPYIWDNHSCTNIKQGKAGAHTYNGNTNVIAIVRLK